LLTEKKKQAIADLAALRTDSATNAKNIASLLAKLESDNFPIESNGASLTPMFDEPIKLTDSAAFMAGADRVANFKELRIRKKSSEQNIGEPGCGSVCRLACKKT